MPQKIRSADALMMISLMIASLESVGFIGPPRRNV
jgi:hypothetical protein